MKTNFLRLTSLAATLALLGGCATETHQAVQVEKPVTAAVAYNGPRSPIAIGQFDNRSQYLRGIFSDGVDRLGGQAKTLLIGHLQETGRFSVLDRDNLQGLSREAGFSGKAQSVQGADYMITGDVTEFGRKETGDMQLFGILGAGKKQTAYSKVTLNVVDVSSSSVVYSASGAGQYALSDREVVGFGSTSGYDSTLNGKVLDLAIREACDRLVEGLEQGRWQVSKAAK
jgi:curli biogenesis system outer membrane secretion channel CsgG